MSLSRNFIPEKSFTVRRLVHCPKCAEEIIIPFVFDAELLKKIFDETKEVKAEDIDKIFRALVNLPPNVIHMNLEWEERNKRSQKKDG